MLIALYSDSVVYIPRVMGNMKQIGNICMDQGIISLKIEINPKESELKMVIKYETENLEIKCKLTNVRHMKF